MSVRMKIIANIVVCGLAILALPLSSLANAKGVAKNTTGLPTYPKETSSIMDAQPRDWRGHQCTHYASSSDDPLATVESWYRKELPGAKEAPVNADAQYGPFKLDGIKFSHGVDVVNVYRMQGQKDTAIELFKCR